ncbi:cysteine synthase A [Leptospira bourretii]|uniref:Cysteine synthase n=5 Tax=Leptospira TaxID=171 RepID=A0A4R9ILV9_9LEPT|nr:MULTISPECIES: cysteine synthase A [Leptospira]PKA23246.1 cysteine synthase A [Leptospira sp. mixed culture ATI2-C-A1]EKJ85066.1 cysteine synthase A [Leptospira meyeri serovar Hardjo str. Went 5]EMJ85997.1 cysteine synthase A [Leptospira meyeri serovar Semaranga str. Veldrot Semarang 173]MCG6142522.1 cysteine synthase A [Leptospira mtsangambouensis]MCG6142879.1 cysteine synthase A [Leptospira bandrabouensis]
MKLNSILEAIGNTPHVRLSRLFGTDHEVYMKLERQNPGGSIKDRIALAMIEEAEKSGKLKKDSFIVEPTSGNTGIGLAMVAAVKGYAITLVMPEHMSVERRRIMAAYGAKFELTPREKGMPGAIAKAQEIVAANPNAWMPQQFENEANIQVHREKTAEEIAKDFPDGLDYIITGVGTGGHITGCAENLKKRFPKLKVFAVEPEGSPVLSGGKPGPHPLQGIGAGFIPKNCKTELLDGIITVGKDEAFTMAVLAAKKEGIFIGTSSGASLAAVSKKLKEIPAGSKVLTFCYDTGERYLSVEGLFV